MDRPAAARTANPRAAAAGEAPRPGFRIPATTDRGARTRTRTDARARDDARAGKANVPTGGSAMKPWELHDERGADRSSDRNRSGAPRFGRNKPDASRSGPRAPRGDGPTRGGPASGGGSPRPSGGRPPGGGFKGGPKGGPRGGRS